jgi:hypothetical protein
METYENSEYVIIDEIGMTVEDSRQAVKIFNSINTKKRTIAAFHLTC